MGSESFDISRGNMNMRRAFFATCVAVLLIGVAAPVGAQRLLWLNVGGGVSIPQGDLSDPNNVGWNALASVALSVPMQPLGLRADLAYNQFGFNSTGQALFGGSGHQSVGSATLNATYRLSMPGTPLSPYLITGLGVYRTDCSPGCDGVTHLGWNFGLGTKLYVLGFRSFIEARYHLTEANEAGVHYFPVTVGLTF